MLQRPRPYRPIPVLLGLAALAFVRIAFAAPAGPAPVAAPIASSVIELQPFRQVSSGRIESASGEHGTATLINLNPGINAWYVLSVLWADGSRSSYHLENPRPHAQRLALDPGFAGGVELLEGAARAPCELFDNGANDSLAAAAKSSLAYASLCAGRLLLRNRVKGHQTRLEAEAEFVRNQLWGGEKITVLFHHLLSDTHRETAALHAAADYAPAAVETGEEPRPLAAMVDARYANEVLSAGGLGIPLQGVRAGLTPGAWYAARDSAGVYVSVLEPQLIDGAILAGNRDRVNTLDSVEASSLVYLVAFDLDRFDLHYALGTAHPSVEWSEHIPPAMREPKSPGPDDIGTIAPLVATGQIAPEAAQITVASFTGGFKRAHGAFKYGPLAIVNHASHYGFLENGVVLSRLQPELATLLVLDDGSVQMRTWQAQDESLLGRIRYARQNGVPVVEMDERSQSVPGRWVKEWGPGNWSGSEDMRLRTLRAAAAMQWSASKHFLIYAVFTDATPSAMARVFQAYRCRYAMPLDMNALEHSYLALYRHTGSELQVEYLLQGMREVDKPDSGPAVPRFLAYPDNRDFFYITRRGQ